MSSRLCQVTKSRVFTFLSPAYVRPSPRVGKLPKSRPNRPGRSWRICRLGCVRAAPFSPPRPTDWPAWDNAQAPGKCRLGRLPRPRPEALPLVGATGGDGLASTGFEPVFTA